MKSFFKFAKMAIALTVASMLIISCSSDDDEIVVEDNAQSIEVTIEGNVNLWIINGEFFGYSDHAEVEYADRSCIMTCNQTGLEFEVDEYGYKVYASFAPRYKMTYPFAVKMEGDAKMILAIQFMNYGGNDLIVTLKGYKGVKQTNYLKKTIDHSMVEIRFHADKSDDTTGEEKIIEL